MSLLAFDASGSINADYGVKEHQLDSVAEEFERIRAKIAEANPFPCDNLAQKSEDESSRFFRLPEKELADYAERREGSLLGRIFKVANTIHEQIDAVVVLGRSQMIEGPRAIMQASCEPFHNELSRAERGSRPRMYFGGSDFDNDTRAALLQRLSLGGYVDTPPEKRWALVMIDSDRLDACTTLESRMAFHQTLRELEKSNWLADPSKSSNFVIPIARPDGPLGDIARSLGCEDVFEICNDVPDASSVLSSASLMPAALLGLDCMMLLEGAAMMNHHFLQSPFSENIVLQYAAVHHLLRTDRQITTRTQNVWSGALAALGKWYERLIEDQLAGIIPLTWMQRHEFPNHHQVITQWVVESPRIDPLATVLSDRPLPHFACEAIQHANRSAGDLCCPTMTISLSHIDSHTLGQFFQMLMIATWVEHTMESQAGRGMGKNAVHGVG
ncbi:glucose-6-phosphate isomerase [Novipirellula artificiosorum]|uniref:Glucose-6-phosphate isomerase B n=1 Tax=Novipirellula artificiosorum TaxID=2528016 RepID=A0A5C6E072_9BACT|nr:glucose-6-phosphate isomerase [Novipirellula artificiosorum]TWU42298.1 Glucose-6-phosphate isomerase B [Novipirellula artificiosorum]